MTPRSATGDAAREMDKHCPAVGGGEIAHIPEHDRETRIEERWSKTTSM